MAEQNGAQVRQQHPQYHSPHSYPSPSTQPAYTYPPPQGPPNSEPYRASPTASSIPLQSLNLPPIRPTDGQPQPPPQPQAQQPSQQPMGSPLPPPVAPINAYYAHSMPPPGQPMGITSQPHGSMMRYQLPAQGSDQRIMSGGRHKKEIKRRTKTGCLTCRKRRIKCDEAHPTCRNCQKSKRECLGYDPIFKQQPGPPQIQPAPSAAPPSAPTSAISAPPHAAYSNVPQGYAPAASAGYAPGLGAPVYPPAPAPDPAYEIGPAIDPALAAAEPAGITIPPVSYTNQQDMSAPIKSEAPHPAGQPVPIEDLFVIGGHAPSPIPQNYGPVASSVIEEIRVLYSRDYAPGLDRWLETSWYSTKGFSRLMADARVLEMFAHLLEQFRAVQNDYEGLRRLPSLEARLVWNLFCLCRPPAATTNGANGATPGGVDQQTHEVAKRLEVFEYLVTNRTVETNPAEQIAYPVRLEYWKDLEVKFWRNLGTVVSRRPQDPDGIRAIQHSLGECRNLLGQLENRDVIYSMAIARHIGPRIPEFPNNLHHAYNNDDADERTKLFIAKRFIEDEAQGKGTTQVIQRLCDMAIKSWQALR
ncbi:hypothetical protein H2201_001340 [Coniosporium apollinis]|uniref:Zn(2)-C6 fungal-type domain-containing protein n=1 Tax=Coniosporium apollinis TaxID=61459 RepID=A0ABQ9P2U9_9PEZI|nr:hypothetical protein H2201_001340 [Coniosporium apollinis]